MSYFRSIPGGRHAGLSEGELWDLFRKGEKEAFDLIYHNYVHLLYNYGIRISSDTVLVEDGIQDLFVEIWQKRATLGATGSIKYYLFKSLRRKISRKVLRETRFYHKLLNRSGVDFELSPEQTLLDGESFE
ncbi:MAG TPA: sigma factor, partial [Anseongella sp.]|nr:sigma factor [Anseongella sp.]